MNPPPFIEVAFPIPLNRTFHYRAPASGPSPARRLGARVRAPFGRSKTLVGYVIAETAQTPPFATKEIVSWLDADSFIDETLLGLARWLSERYLCSLGEALASIAPPQLEAPKRPRAPKLGQTSSDAGTQGHPAVSKSSVPMLTLSADQDRVLKRLLAAADAPRFESFLLRGITDSGKTEVYLRVMDRALDHQRQALFLLPEIALTPPFYDRLRERYGPEHVGLWHSSIAAGERYRILTGVHSGKIRVLLGARSAVFAPFPALGVIILDEEHEPAYKQVDRPRYHTREVAIERAQQSHAVLVMGSATPSLESYWNAKRGRYTLLELTSRVEERRLPLVTLVDRRPPPVEPAAKKRARGAVFSVFSEPLKLAMEQKLARREQILLFVNRRGFTPFLRCGTCGWVARCPRCATTLAMHLNDDAAPSAGARPAPRTRPVPAEGALRCHACLHTERVPIQCPACKGMRLRSYGVGTQRVEEELRKLFPFVKSVRLDKDVASSHRRYEAIYRDFAARRYDVLVGTQMIAKGFDFPHVTLVGVVDADVSLHLPDFRSAERTFQLIAQVAGRAGRGTAPGMALVQTHHPEHYALRAAQAHDFPAFYDEEIRHRQALNYPPFCRLARILIRAARDAQAQEAAEALRQRLEPMAPPGGLLGPAPAPYARLRNQFRYQMVLKGDEASLKPALDFLRSYRSAKGYVSVDVDPADLL
ncbi:MAG TPA: primosomal protein N' [Elusimicrobiota bacterium]|nr:primosomal protein N' [Elusimicrobiota bacterium]